MPCCDKDFLNKDKSESEKIISFACAGGSMRPLLRDGDTVFVEPDAAIGAGDCVCYTLDGKSFIHRVIKVKNGSYLVGSDSVSVKKHWIESSLAAGKVLSRNPFMKGKFGLFFYYCANVIFSAGRLFKKSL